MSAKVSGDCQRKVGSSMIKQCNSSFICQQERGNEVPNLVSQVVGGHDVVPRKQSLSVGQ